MKSRVYRSRPVRASAGRLLAKAPGLPAKRSKYGAKPTTIMHNGKEIRCASKAEAKRFGELILLEKAREISMLRFHERFALYAQKASGEKILAPVAHYVTDASYVEKGRPIVEEIKGFETEAWKIKRRWFEACYPHVELRILKKGRVLGSQRLAA